MRRCDVAFFLTGAAALVHEAIWARLLARVLGSHASATAVILAVFMAGLGLGALLLSRPARRTSRPGRLFALLELSIGLWAALSPWILRGLDPVDGTFARALVAGLALLPPTIAMGGTFPLMGRLTIAATADAGAQTSGFYGANTLGACLGVLFGTLVLMPTFGLSGGLAAGALLNAGAAALVWGLGAPTRTDEAARTEGRAKPVAAGGFDTFLFVPLLFGLSSLALEVLFTRILVTVTGASIYAFAIVLAVFLFGIGLGSRQARASLARPGGPARLLAATALAVPALALLGVLALRWQLGEPDLFASLANRMPAATGTMKLWTSHVMFAVLALSPAAVCFGMALPAAAALACERAPAAPIERTLGRVYAANTLGSLAGSLAAGFVLMPVVGARVGFALALAPCLLAALLVPGRSLGRVGLGTLAALALGVLALRPAPRPGGAEVLYFATGVAESVAVEEIVEPDGTPTRSLRINGKVEASTAQVDLRLQRLLGHIPGLLHGDVKSALVIGMGTGMTAGSLLDLPTLERLTLFELEARVPDAAAFFADWNGPLLPDPRTHVVIADGRHALRRTSERFDLITADPIHVWSRGSSDLYTLEYFETMRARLAAGGIASQWLPLYELSTLDVKTVAASWCAAFPHTRAYLTAYDLALIGSPTPLHRDLAATPLPPRVAAALAPLGLHSGAELAALRVADDADLRTWCSGVAPMRDDRPVLEFRAPFSFLSGYSVEVLRWAGRPEFVERLPEASRGRAREVRSLLGTFLDELPVGLSEAARSYGNALLALPAPAE